MTEPRIRAKVTASNNYIEGYYVKLVDVLKGKISHRIYTGLAETDGNDFYPDWVEIEPDTIEEL